jgi:hypothetical protein
VEQLGIVLEHRDQRAGRRRRLVTVPQQRRGERREGDHEDDGDGAAHDALCGWTPHGRLASCATVPGGRLTA